MRRAEEEDEEEAEERAAAGQERFRLARRLLDLLELLARRLRELDEDLVDLALDGCVRCVLARVCVRSLGRVALSPSGGSRAAAARSLLFFGGFRARRPIVFTKGSRVRRRGALSMSMAVVDFWIAARGRNAVRGENTGPLS